MNLATPLLYTGLVFGGIAVGALAYGLLMQKAEKYTLVRNKAVDPQNVRVRQ